MNANKICNSHQIKVISFDIFDTLITRNVAQPSCIFLSVWEEYTRKENIGISMDQDAFKALRKESEQSARDNSEYEDISISQIYRYLKKISGFSEKEIDKIKKIEIELESSSLFPVPENIELLKKIRSCGKKIVLTSDMYLDRETIVKILKKNRIYENVDELYLSSDVGLRKVSGELYTYVLDKENIKPYELLHIGDNFIVDVIRPFIKKRISSLHYKGANGNRYSKLVLGDQRSSPRLINSIFAGAMKVASLDAQYAKDPMFKFGVDVIAPVLVSYVIWIIQSAKKRNLKTLYFLSRDGYLLYIIAKYLGSRFNYELDLKYLYGSRQSLHLPSVINVEKDLYDWFVQNTNNIEINALSARVGIEAIYFCKVLNDSYGFDLVPDSRVDSCEVEKIYKCIVDSDELRGLLEAKAQEKRDLIRRYFTQEGLLDNDEFAFVDLGWSGRMIGSIQRILFPEGDNGKVLCYFWGDNNSSIDQQGTVEISSYFYGPSTFLEYKEFGVSISHLLEIVCFAKHGSVRGFSESGNSIVPVFGDMENPNSSNEFLNMQKGIKCFVDKLSPLAFNHNILSLRPQLFELVKDFYLHPPKILAVKLGEMQFSTDLSGRQRRDVAPQMSLLDCSKYLLFYFKGNRGNYTSWIHGSRMRSSLVVNFLLSLSSFAMRLFFYFYKRLVRIF